MLALACAGPTRAFADESRVKSYEEAIAKGDSAWDKGQFADARAAYEAAYLIHPEPTLLFNIASTYRRENNSEKALDYYENYLRVAPADDQYRSQAVETVATLKKELAAKQKNQPTRPVPTRAIAQVQASPKDAGDGMNRKQIIGIASGVAGLGALTFAAFQGNKAVSANNKLEKIQPGQQWTPALQEQYDNGKASEKKAIIFSAIGGAAVITGSVFYYLGHRERRDSERLTVAPVTDGTMAGAMVFGSF